MGYTVVPRAGFTVGTVYLSLLARVWSSVVGQSGIVRECAIQRDSYVILT